MNAAELTCLALIKEINQSDFFGWFDPMDVMAFCEIESSFNPNAERFEPHLNESSYGLMQLLFSTARQMGYKENDANNLRDPRTNIHLGMSYLRWLYGFLASHFARDPTKQEWVEAYNEGPGNVLKRRLDIPYWQRWSRSRAGWDSLGTFH